MANTRGNAHEADLGNESFLHDPDKDRPVRAQTERGGAWVKADEARARANDLASQAAAAKAEADDLEAKAIADDNDHEYEAADASAGTWEAAVTPAAEEVVA